MAAKSISEAERVKWCRESARDAYDFAIAASDPVMRDAYLAVKQEWTALADEIEHNARMNAAAAAN